jgi:hypothetical protein
MKQDLQKWSGNGSIRKDTLKIFDAMEQSMDKLQLTG